MRPVYSVGLATVSLASPRYVVQLLPLVRFIQKTVAVESVQMSAPKQPPVVILSPMATDGWCGHMWNPS